eukprot:TRINITY_DN6484_c0_g2_i1.p1 TRINITY_DN6484_c0_g2~~TRINITY_DN6484_c0_g2_i1.p1  ORF type:complete len:1130 (+),score=280.23 TRINITY_DN6484_c0_g2_i1:18-3407(+)
MGRGGAPGEGTIASNECTESTFDFADIRGTVVGAEQLRDVAAELQDEVRRVALRQLRQLVLPLMRSVRARRLRAARAAGRRAADSRIAEALQRSALLSFWPERQLQRLAAASTALTAEAGQVVIFEGESAASGIYVMMRGRAQIVKRGLGAKSVSPACPGNSVIAEVDAVQVLGDFTQLTEQPRTASAVALEESDWVVVPSAVFARELALLPERLRQRVYDEAFAKRREIMWTIFPMGHADVRRSFLFAHFSTEQLDVIVQCLQPRCYRQGDCLCHFGQSGAEMFFLRRGEVDVLVPELPSVGQGSPPLSPGMSPKAQPQQQQQQQQQQPEQSSQPRPSSPRRQSRRRSTVGMRCVKTMQRGVSFGEYSLVFGEKRSATIRARTHCDVWVLHFSNLEQCLSDSAMLERVCQAGVAQRIRFLQEQEGRTLRAIGPDGADPEGRDALLRFVQNCPLLRDVCPLPCLADVRRALTPRCCRAGEPILSSADICDRLMVITRGRALVQQNRSAEKQWVHVGECIGFTCLAEHRWAHAVLAQELCDIWELPRGRLAQILQQHGVRGRAAALTKRLLLSDLDRPPCNVTQCTPPLYPTVGSGIDPMAPPKILGFAAGESERGADADRQLAQRPAPHPRSSALDRPAQPQQQQPQGRDEQGGRHERRRQSLRLSIALTRGDCTADDALAVAGCIADELEDSLAQIQSPTRRVPSSRGDSSRSEDACGLGGPRASVGSARTPIRRGSRQSSFAEAAEGSPPQGRLRLGSIVESVQLSPRAAPASPRAGLGGRRVSVASFASGASSFAGSPARMASMRRARASVQRPSSASPHASLLRGESSPRPGSVQPPVQSPRRLRLCNSCFSVASASGGSWPGFPAESVLSTAGDAFYCSAAGSGVGVDIVFRSQGVPVQLSRVELRGAPEGSCSVRCAVVWVVPHAAIGSFFFHQYNLRRSWGHVADRPRYDAMAADAAAAAASGGRPPPPPAGFVEVATADGVGVADFEPREGALVAVLITATHGDDSNVDLGGVRLLGPMGGSPMPDGSPCSSPELVVQIPAAGRRPLALPPLGLGPSGARSAWGAPPAQEGSPRGPRSPASPFGSPRGAGSPRAAPRRTASLNSPLPRRSASRSRSRSRAD